VPRIHFQLELAELKDQLLAMAALSQQAVESAVDAFLLRDKGLCKYVKQNERAIDTAQRDLDEMAYELLLGQAGLGCRRQRVRIPPLLPHQVPTLAAADPQLGGGIVVRQVVL
jgi:phosphate uptake regulator